MEAAFGVFIRYGFKRTSMSDLAEATGVSRPGLYTHFSNKEDMFRAVAAHQMGAALDRGLEALRGTGHLCDRLLDAYTRWNGDFLELFESTPHAREILDTNQTLAGDIAGELAARFRHAAIAAVDEAHDAGAIDVARSGSSPEEIVQLLSDVSNGLKYSLCDGASYRSRLTVALRFVDAMIRKTRSRAWSPRSGE